MWLGLCGYWKWFMAPREGVGKGVLGVIGRLEVGDLKGRRGKGRGKGGSGWGVDVLWLKLKIS